MAHRPIVFTLRGFLAQRLSAPLQKIRSGKLTRLSETVSTPFAAQVMGKVATSWRQTITIARCTVNKQLAVLISLLSKQCPAIIAQRIRRTVQMVGLYSRLGYDGSAARRLCGTLMTRANRDRRRAYMLLGAVIFSWDKEKITDEEIDQATREMSLIDSAASGRLESHGLSLWQKLIDEDHLQVWRKPLPSTSLYEYKVFGRYRDIPARAFFQAQSDVAYRKQWDKLVIKVDVIDADDLTGCDVVHWVTHYPYPMYGREYVYIRKTLIDTEKNLMVLMCRAIDHPLCPINPQYVRVDHYLSHMVIKPHTSFDEDGFDYILTYYDNPKGSFPSFAYNWMASTGVPDFVDKMHSSAVRLHERQMRRRREEEDEVDEETTTEGQKMAM